MKERSSSPDLDVERIGHHLQRPGFRISELQIGPAQQVPWHSHTSIGDTFCVLAGRIRVSLRDPEERVELGRWQSWGLVLPGRPHRVTNAGSGSATFWLCMELAMMTSCLPGDSRGPRRPVIAGCVRGRCAAARTPR
jgi:quercetin dioxygenase-like cupin family protein